jgi:hypothetical protein
MIDASNLAGRMPASAAYVWALQVGLTSGAVTTSLETQ